MAIILRREITDGTQVQGTNEAIPYRLITTNWGGSPTNPSVAAYQRNADGTWLDVTATVFPVNSPTVSGDHIILSNCTGIVEGQEYRIEIRWTEPGGGIVEAYAYLRSER